MRPDHSSTLNETLPPTSTSTAHAHHSARAAGGVASNAAAAATTSSSRGMGGSGRVHGGGGSGDRGGGTAARPMKAVDVPELVLKLCKNILKKERDVSMESVLSRVLYRKRSLEGVRRPCISVVHAKTRRR